MKAGPYCASFSVPILIVSAKAPGGRLKMATASTRNIDNLKILTARSSPFMISLSLAAFLRDEIDQRRHAVALHAFGLLAVVGFEMEDLHVGEGVAQELLGIEILDERRPARAIGELLGAIALDHHEPAGQQHLLHARKKEIAKSGPGELKENPDHDIEARRAPVPGLEIGHDEIELHAEALG